MKKLLIPVLALLASVPAAFAHNFGSETVAFYAFEDGEVGTSAVGVTLKNAIDNSFLPGRVEISGKGTVTFSDEAPGAYIYTNLEYTAGGPVYTNPKSLYFSKTGGTLGASNRGTVFFDDLMKEAQKLGAFKIEFWYKFDTGSADDTSGFFDVYGGWSHDDGKGNLVGTNAVLRFMPRYINASHAAGEDPYYYMSKKWRKVSDGQWGSQTKFGNYNYPAGTSFIDGKWHHVSFAMPMGEYSTDNPFAFGCDMNQTALSKALRDANVYYADNPEDTQRFIQLNASGKFVGWVSCVRLSRMNGAVKNYLTQLDWLRPYSVEKPREYLRYRFDDGVAGQPFADSIVTNYVGYSYLNPNIYVLPASMVAYGPAVGRAPGNGEIIAYNAETGLTVPTAVADVKKAKVLENAEDTEGRANALSVQFVAPSGTDETAFSVGYGLLTRVGTYLQPQPTEAQTYEFFFKFDYEDWKARAGGATNQQVSLMWVTQKADLTSDNQYLATFGVGMDIGSGKNPSIGCFGFTGTTKSGKSKKLIDGKWHHVAAILEPYANLDDAYVSLYLDGEKLVDRQTVVYFRNRGAPGYSNNKPEGRNIWFARSTAKNETSSYNTAFNGRIDEIRISKGVLEPSEFLQQKNMTGMTLIVR